MGRLLRGLIRLSFLEVLELFAGLGGFGVAAGAGVGSAEGEVEFRFGGETFLGEFQFGDRVLVVVGVEQQES